MFLLPSDGAAILAREPHYEGLATRRRLQEIVGGFARLMVTVRPPPLTALPY